MDTGPIGCPLCGALKSIDPADPEEIRQKFRAALLFGLRNDLVTPDDIFRVLTELVASEE